MVKVKLSIDPNKPEQVEALNLLLIAIGMTSASKMTFGNHNPNANMFANPLGHSVGFEQNEHGAKVTTQLTDPPASVDLRVHDMVETQKEAEKPKGRKVKATFIPDADKPKEDSAELNIFEQAEEQAATEETEPKEEAETTDETAEPAASLEQIREALGKKVTEHRDAIKAKLTALGAKNVSVLGTEHYTPFYNFLISL